MSANLLRTGANAAAREYVYALEAAYKHAQEVYDPDYALNQDPDVYDVIRRDPETAHAIEQRKHLVAGTRWRVTPASDVERDRRAAAALEQIVGGVRQFAAARFQLAEAIFRGTTWAFVEGRWVTRSIAGGAPRRWWIPHRLRPVDKRRFRQVVNRETKRPEWELYSVERGRYEPLGDRRRWFVRVAYDETEDSVGHGRGLVEGIYHWQYAKAKVLAEGLGGLERWAQGVVVGKIDTLNRPGSTAKDNESQANEWLRVLEIMRSRHVLIHGREDELQLIESTGSGHAMVKDFLSYLRDGIRVLVLGANLPTGATSGGSYALAEVQENSTEALVKFDRDLIGEAISEDLIGLLWALNAQALRAEGLIEADRPRFEIVSQMRRDPTAAASAIATLLNAGVRGLREDEVFEVLGFTPAGPFDRQLEVSAPAGAGVATAAPSGEPAPAEAPPE